MKTILGIWAHPDDEVFLSGGFMAKAVAEGDRVVCLHFTRGEAGLYHRQLYPADVLAAVRARELEESLARLGVHEQRFLDLPDGRLGSMSSEEVTVRLHDALVAIDPDMVVTFGSDGFTGHPDHKSLSSLVTSAARLWNKPQARVLHAAVPGHWEDCIVARLDEFDFFWPGHSIDYAKPDVVVELEGEVLAAKVEAIRAHASQMESLFDAYGEGFMRDIAATEVFRLGPRPAFRRRMLLDLSRG